MTFTPPDAEVTEVSPRSVRRRARSATRNALLDSAVTRLEQSGEGGLRVEDVLADAGASPSSLYHYFGSRDGLVEAATIEMFRRQDINILDDVATVIRAARNNDELLSMIPALTVKMGSPEIQRRRRLMLAAMGAAAVRPELWRQIGELQAETNRAFAELVAEGQQRGVIRNDLDPEGIATFIRAHLFGRVLGEMYTDAPDAALWAEITLESMRGILAPPATSAPA